MIVAIASGKGGTGKTTIAAALARTWDAPRIAVDMDVEAPNLHLLLSPTIEGEEEATLDVPVVVEPENCDGCGACSDICAFKAILVLRGKPAIFTELCHGCDGCLQVCLRGVLGRGKRDLGTVSWGRANAADRASSDLRMVSGRMRICENTCPPLIRHVRTRLDAMLRERQADVIIDAPPGTNCPALTALRDIDVLLLVTEPTPFGLHDLDLAVRAFQSDRVPAAVVINRAGLGDDELIRAYCRRGGLPVVAEIPYRRDLAERCARGEPLEAMGADLRERIAALAGSVRALAHRSVAA
ncbi:ATP-binding protein [Xanthobacteraceae bacterium Astr-EGSB]|uniref:nucleotide-binding protein n=1 Tax=Astrobacterium formosum TaxID=3069710 RepID=UPI0027AEF876|nr:ATP-binding protein [Xanthobacteraceae bacterium Astr-EGSB]